MLTPHLCKLSPLVYHLFMAVKAESGRREDKNGLFAALDRRWQVPARLVRDKLIDWLALDLFGTVLLRPVPFAEDMAFLLAHELAAKDALDLDVSIAGVASLRVRAEQRLRQAISGVKLADIHAALPRHYFKNTPAERASLEQALERRSLRPNPDAFALMALAKINGVKIALIADTPHDSAFLKDVLRGVAPSLEPEMMLVSSEWPGGDWPLVFRDIVDKTGGAPKRLVYIGAESKDIALARTAGLRTIFLPRRTLEQTEILSREWETVERRAAALHPALGDFGLTDLRARLGFLPPPPDVARASLRPWFDWGCTVMGPLLTLFADWTAERVRVVAGAAGERPVIHCFMREGYLLAPLLRARAPDIEVHETWINRYVAVKACLAEGKLQDMIQFLNRPSPPSVAQACEELRLPLPEDMSPDLILADGMETRFHAYATSPRIMPALVAQSARARAGLLAHLRRQADLQPGSRFFIMDLGYNGTTQRALQRLFDIEFGGQVLTYGFYLATSALYADMKPALAAEGWLIHGSIPEGSLNVLKRSPEPIEQSCMPPVGTLLEHDADGEPVCEAGLLPPWQAVQIAAVQQGIRTFASHCPRLPASDPHLVRQMRELMLRAIGRPTGDEARFIGDWLYDENFGSKAVRRLADNPQLGRFDIWPMERLIRLPNRELPWLFAAARRYSSVMPERLYKIHVGEADPDLFNADDGELVCTLIFANFGAGFSKRNASVSRTARTDRGVVQSSCGIVCRTQRPTEIAIQCGLSGDDVFALHSLKLSSHKAQGRVVLVRELKTAEDFAGLRPVHVQSVRPGFYRKQDAGGALIWQLPPLGEDVTMVGVEVTYTIMRAVSLPIAQGTGL